MKTIEPATMRVPFTELIDLAAENVGGKTLAASDDFFAPKENLLKEGRGVFIDGKFTDNGKWMDGWESRRKREPGNDWCTLKLGLPGEIRGLNIDTNHFIGNYPEFASAEACAIEGDPAPEKLSGARWTEILPKSRLHGGTQNIFPVISRERFTHLRLNIFPDGGVARLRVYGVVKPDWAKLKKSAKNSNEPIDLACAENGGTVVTCNDMFFGHKDSLILPGRAANMGEGWETRRKREPGNDWIVVRLGAAGTIRKIEVDTNHFKGNFPDSCAIDALFVDKADELPADYFHHGIFAKELPWKEILPKSKLQAHTRHYFEKEVRAQGSATHVRLRIFPDGGVSRLRVYGDIA